MGDDVGSWNVSAYNQGNSDRGEVSTFTGSIPFNQENFSVISGSDL